MGPRKIPDTRAVRAKHEQAIAALTRQRAALQAEIATLEARRKEVANAVILGILDLIDLHDTLERIADDAEFVRRKAAIRDMLRDRAARRARPAAEIPTAGLPAALARQLHDLVNRIQQENAYAHVSGDFSEKTFLQNLLLANHADRVAVRWDGAKLLLIEYEGRSAGHLPVELLSPEARAAVGGRLGLATT
ncbi:MAG: hypothetical protein FJZ01_21920 [Candidatus Sericytochromatia bacterium]|nr:hypothetical protein [Candidatus Tanganyikabacteria bacterium]